jgi:ABC-type multidrug transport system fused ATPase/permease subunit
MAQDATRINTRRVVRYLLQESFKDRKLFLVLVLLPISTLCISTALPYIISKILAGLAQAGDSYNWQTMLVYFGIFAFIGTLANRIGFLLLLEIQAHTLERTQNDVLHNLLKKGSDFYANHMTGKITSDTTGLGAAFIQFQDVLAINAIPFIITMAAGILLVLTNSLVLGVGLLVMTVSVIGGAIYSTRKRAPLREIRHEAQRQHRGYFADIIINNQAVKTFAQEKYEEEQHGRLNKSLRNHRLVDWRLVSRDGNNRIIVILLLQIVFVTLIALQVSENPALLAAGIFSFAFTVTLSNRLFEISTMIRQIENAVTEASSMVEIMDLKPSIVDAKGAKRLQITKGNIAFNKVHFAY